MNYSQNEIYNLVHKACRGAGIALGQAEFAAKVVSFQTSNAVINALLMCIENEKAQLVFQSEQNLQNLCPLRDIPIIAQAFEGHTKTWLCLNGRLDPYFEAACAFSGIVCEQTSHGISLSKSEEPFEPKPMRADLDQAVLERLNSLAALTYVPETEASRVSGAGAGLNDND